MSDTKRVTTRQEIADWLYSHSGINKENALRYADEFIDSHLVAIRQSIKFVHHIEKHLEGTGLEVCCKICNKTIKEIDEE